ncbi:unnamed protein product [Calypogeia fissa]
MTDASSDSDDSAGRTQDWEVVSLPTLSMSGSVGGNLCACEVCTSAMEAGATGSGRSAGSGIIVDAAAGGPQANFLSNHFGSVEEDHKTTTNTNTTSTRSPMLDQFLGSEGESRTAIAGDGRLGEDEEEGHPKLHHQHDHHDVIPMEADEDLDGGNPNNGNHNTDNDENRFVDTDMEEKSHVTAAAAAAGEGGTGAGAQATNSSYGKQEQDFEGASGTAAAAAGGPNYAPKHAPNYGPNYAPNYGPKYGPNYAPNYGPNDAPDMDWIEPTTPNSSSTLMREESDVGSNSSMIYDLGCCEKKPSAESDFREPAGPLLGSCMSAPSAAAIVSSVAAFRAGLAGEDIVPHHHHPMGGEESAMATNCVVEEELAGLEREILGTDSGFESFHDAPVVNTKKLGLDDRHSALADALLGGEEGANEDQSTYEAWWKRRAALWFVEARQANTLWSLALAAAVMGLVILGQRWQHERCQNNHLRMQLCRKDEKISQLIFQVARLKDALSGRRRVPVLRSSSSYSSFRDRF